MNSEGQCFYSLKLVKGPNPPEPAHLALPCAEGYLVVACAPLLKRGACTTTAACVQAVATGLVTHGRAMDRFAPRGFTVQWAEHMQRFAGDLQAQEGLRRSTAAGRREEPQRYREITGRLTVLRSALLGDLGLLCKAAALVLPREEAAALQMQRLLPPWRRQRRGQQPLRSAGIA